VVSEWIRDGHPPVDLWEVDVRRNMPFQINRNICKPGCLKAWVCCMQRIGRSGNTKPRAARANQPCTTLAAAGACFGEAFGWERPNWYAPAGVAPRYEYSYGRQNWFEHSANGIRRCAMPWAYSTSPLSAKYRLEGPDATRAESSVRQRCRCGPGQVIYTRGSMSGAGSRRISP